MPVKLLVALLLFALAFVLDLSTVADGTAGGATYLGLAFKLFLIVGLIRGSEAARTIALVVAVLNLIGGALLLFTVGPALALFGPKVYLLIAMPFVFGGYLLWCMNQEDVKTWLYKRAYGRHGE